jgi:hypothetical protein
MVRQCSPSLHDVQGRRLKHLGCQENFAIEFIAAGALIKRAGGCFLLEKHGTPASAAHA